MKAKIRKGDTVEIIKGNDRARSGQPPTRGTVLQVLPEAGLVVVEGVNVRTHHEKVRPNKDGSQSGGLIKREAPVALSNVALVDPKTNKPVRVGIKVVDGKRVRYTRGKNASGATLD
jgi:large subunit ribosomal protein L24